MINNPTLLKKSSQTRQNPFMSTDDCLRWIEDKRKATHVSVTKIPFAQLTKWYTDQTTGNIHHESGQFFTIEGLQVETNFGHQSHWSQPIICQPETGILGIITKEINGVLYFLMQAKIEPGNVNAIQLSPTVQATKSNYTKVHQGKTPKYLEYFLNASDHEILLDQLQSEQGAKFYKKRNRNVIIKVKNNIEVHDGFCWLTLGQLLELLNHDNIVNMDTRSILSGIQYAFEPEESYKTETEILSWFAGLKTKYHLNSQKIPLAQVKHWKRNDTSIYHEDHKHFSVLAVSVEIEDREVRSWSQPIVESTHHGLIAFLTKKIYGVDHYLVQGKVEAGSFDVLEIAPTVQCVPDNYKNTPKENKPAFLDYILNADEKNILHSSFQSEEGGRFYHQQNRNLILKTDDAFPTQIPEDFMWITLAQLKQLVRFSNYLNIETRSLLAILGSADQRKIRS